MLLYTFTIHDEDREVPYFSCIAADEVQAISKCRSVGYKDFSLSETRGLEPHETSEYALQNIAKNPFVGSQWLPVIKAFSIYIEAREINRREPTWSVDVYAFDPDAGIERRCFVQGLVEMDGSMHLELSADLSTGDGFTAEQIAQLEFVGWQRFDNLEIFFIEFEPGWNSLYIGERIIEALTSVHGITEDGVFAFSFDTEIRRAIDEQTGLVDITIRERSGVSPLHTMPDSPAISWANEARSFIEASEGETTAIPEPDRESESVDDFDSAEQPFTEDLQFSVQLAHIYGAGPEDSNRIHVAAFRGFNGEILLEVMPRIFLTFSPTNAPTIEDFAFIPMPWLRIDSNQLTSEPPRFYVNIEPWNEFLADFAQSVYSEEASAALPQDVERFSKHEFTAWLVAVGIYGDSRDHAGGLLLDRAAELQTIEYPVHAQDGNSEVYAAAAWLSYVPGMGQRSYFRPISSDDLRSWQIPRNVIDALAPFWPSIPKNLQFGDPDLVAVTTRLDPTYRQLRLAELRLEWVDVSIEIGQSRIVKRYDDARDVIRESEHLSEELRNYRQAIAAEAARLLGCSKLIAADWLNNPYGLEMEVVYSPDRPEVKFLRRQIEMPADVDVLSGLRGRVADIIFNRQSAPNSFEFFDRETALAVRVISEVLARTTGQTQLGSVPFPTLNSASMMALVESKLDGLDIIDFYGNPIFRDSHEITQYVEWMAGRIVASVHLINRGLSIDEIAAGWAPRQTQSLFSPGRKDELVLTALYLDTLLWCEPSIFSEQGFIEYFVNKPTRRWKDVVHYTFFRELPEAKVVFGKRPNEIIVDEIAIARLIDSARAQSREFQLKAADGGDLSWQFTVSSHVDGVQLALAFHTVHPSLAVGALRRAQEYGFERVGFERQGHTASGPFSLEINAVLPHKDVSDVETLSGLASRILKVISRRPDASGYLWSEDSRTPEQIFGNSH